MSSPAFIEYINKGFPSETRKEMPEFDYVYCYLASALLRDGNLDGAAATRALDEVMRKLLETTIARSLANTGIPEEIVRRNPGILPAHMQQLLKLFEKLGDGVTACIPVFPESADAVETYDRILQIIDKQLNAKFGEAKRIKSLAILMVNWMKGRPLAVLISDRQRYAVRKGASFNLQQLIRAVMADVEQFARFEAPKFLNCYIDVLRLHALQSGREAMLAEMPDLGIYLEFGVSTPTQLALIGLGLSRTSALALSERIARHDLDKNGVLAWLKQREWENMDIPELVKAEIRVASELIS